MSQLKDDLQATYDTLEARGWCQMWGANHDGAVCLEGAAAAVTMGEAGLWTVHFLRDLWNRESHCGEDRFWAVVDHLTKSIPDAEWDQVYAVNSNSSNPYRPILYRWNDVDFRTVEDVKLLLKRAIEGCDGDG